LRSRASWCLLLKFQIYWKLRDLTVGFNTEQGPVTVLDRVSYKVPKGQTIGLVGESGCGKSVSVMSLMRLLPSPPSFVKEGSIVFNSRDLLTLSSEEIRKVRGNRIGMIFQEPMTSLNPVFSIGWQMAEVLKIHKNIGTKEAEQRCLELLQLIGIGGGRKRLQQYPHELSGGLRQRIMIAMALACNPELLIADEPTTALDVTIQAQILDLLASLQNELQMSVLMITHDLGVVAETCSYVYVMYAGRIIEEAPVQVLFQQPLHPYTCGLMDSRPRLSLSRKWLPTIKGVVPAPEDRRQGCSFAGRCPKAKSRCLTDEPVLHHYAENHATACWEVNR
jgi:peptide/nickel transport system ATP-binding protein